MKKTNAPPGRPKKNKPISIDNYKKVVSNPQNEIAVNEIIISEASSFNNFLKTFKTLKATSLSIIFEETKFSIHALTSDKIQGGSKNKEISLQIPGNSVFSYYCKKPTLIKLNSIVLLEPLILEIDENSRYVTLFTTDRDNSLEYTIEDVQNDIKSSSAISTPPFDYNFNTLEYPTEIEEEIEFRIVGYKTSDIKKILGKKSRKNCNDCRLSALNNVVSIEYRNETDNVTEITLNSKNSSRRIYGQENDKLYSIKFPESDISQFLMYIKKDIEIIFSQDYILMKSMEDGIDIVYKINI